MTEKQILQKIQGMIFENYTEGNAKQLAIDITEFLKKHMVIKFCD